MKHTLNEIPICEFLLHRKPIQNPVRFFVSQQFAHFHLKLRCIRPFFAFKFLTLRFLNTNWQCRSCCCCCWCRCGCGRSRRPWMLENISHSSYLTRHRHLFTQSVTQSSKLPPNMFNWEVPDPPNTSTLSSMVSPPYQLSFLFV